MIDRRTVLAVVPARGGSKGVPLKNIQPVSGVPLIALVGPIVAQVPMIDRAVVSTDHEEIAQLAQEAGIAAPFRRPPEISGDRIGDYDVLTHALAEMERIDKVNYDIVVMLQPTSPLRRPEHVVETIRRVGVDGYDAAWTVSETDSKAHPLKQLVIREGAIDYYDATGKDVVARQQLSTLYHRNGAAYAISRDCLLQQHKIMGDRTAAVVTHGPMVSIDTLWDFKLVEFILDQRSKDEI